MINYTMGMTIFKDNSYIDLVDFKLELDLQCKENLYTLGPRNAKARMMITEHEAVAVGCCRVLGNSQ